MLLFFSSHKSLYINFILKKKSDAHNIGQEKRRMEKEGWKYYEGKKIFVILKNGRQYSGEVLNVNQESPPLIFFTILDKFNNHVTFVNYEILNLEEEK